MKKITTKSFNGVNINFFIENERIYIKRRDLGEALGYAFPSECTAKLHSRHKKLLSPHTKYAILPDANGRTQNTALYDPKSVLFFCFISDQETHEFLRWYSLNRARMEVGIA